MTAPRQMTMLFGEEFDLPPTGPGGPSFGTGDPLPPGPFALSMLFDFELGRHVVPYSVVGADGRTVAGHIPSLEIAKAVRDALNAVHPLPTAIPLSQEPAETV